MDQDITAILEALGRGPFVFNLGHGIVPADRRRTMWRGWSIPCAPGRPERRWRSWPAGASRWYCSTSGVPTRPRRCSRSCSTCSTTRRSSPCRNPCAGLWPRWCLIAEPRLPRKFIATSAAPHRCSRKPDARPTPWAMRLRILAVMAAILAIFIAMRYWHPMSEETALEVSAFAPDRIVLLAAVPPVLDHHHGLVARRLAARSGEVAGSTRRPRATAVIPPSTVWWRPTRRALAPAWTRRRAAAGRDCCFRPTACRKRLSTRATPMCGRSNARPPPWPGRWRPITRIWTGRSATRAGSAPWNGSGPSTDEEELARRRGRRGARGGGAHRLRLGAFRDPGRARHRIP